MLKIKILFFLLPFSMVSQSITGKVYDNESTAKGIEIINTTKNIKIYSNQHGDFKIDASVNDSLEFRSLFHHQKNIKVSKAHFGYTLVVELSKKVNELGEVLLNDTKNQKAFNPIDYTQDVSFGLKEDMKRNPHLYAPSSAYGLDIIRLIKLLIKKKPKIMPIETISYKTYDSLFTNDRFFKKALFNVNLNIEEELKPLFFDYCHSRKLNTKLLQKENQMLLLDSLINLSKAFKTINYQSKKE